MNSEITQAIETIVLICRNKDIACFCTARGVSAHPEKSATRHVLCSGSRAGHFWRKAGSIRPLRNARAGSIARAGEATGAANPDEDRDGRRRGVLAQSGAARRGRRPGACGLSQAARGRPRRQRIRRRSHRSGQDARPGRGILARRSATHRRTAEPAGQGLSRSVGVGGEAARRRGSAAGRARRRRTTSAFADPEWTQNQFFDFLKQAYLLTAGWADKLGAATPRTSIRTPGRRPNSTCGRSPMRCRRRISS